MSKVLNWKKVSSILRQILKEQGENDTYIQDLLDELHHRLNERIGSKPW